MMTVFVKVQTDGYYETTCLPIEINGEKIGRLLFRSSRIKDQNVQCIDLIHCVPTHLLIIKTMNRNEHERLYNINVKEQYFYCCSTFHSYSRVLQ
jgi:hypothetical protein